VGGKRVERGWKEGEERRKRKERGGRAKKQGEGRGGGGRGRKEGEEQRKKEEEEERERERREEHTPKGGPNDSIIFIVILRFSSSKIGQLNYSVAVDQPELH
jgi:hypothetical protein